MKEFFTVIILIAIIHARHDTEYRCLVMQIYNNKELLDLASFDFLDLKFSSDYNQLQNSHGLKQIQLWELRRKSNDPMLKEPPYKVDFLINQEEFDLISDRHLNLQHYRLFKYPTHQIHSMDYIDTRKKTQEKNILKGQRYASLFYHYIMNNNDTSVLNNIEPLNLVLSINLDNYDRFTKLTGVDQEIGLFDGKFNQGSTIRIPYTLIPTLKNNKYYWKPKIEELRDSRLRTKFICFEKNEGNNGYNVGDNTERKEKCKNLKQCKEEFFSLFDNIEKINTKEQKNKINDSKDKRLKALVYYKHSVHTILINEFGHSFKTKNGDTQIITRAEQYCLQLTKLDLRIVDWELCRLIISKNESTIKYNNANNMNLFNNFYNIELLNDQDNYDESLRINMRDVYDESEIVNETIDDFNTNNLEVEENNNDDNNIKRIGKYITIGLLLLFGGVIYNINNYNN